MENRIEKSLKDMKYQCPLSSFVIWAGKRTTLQFSYPVGRRKVFLAKIAVVLLFVATAMVTSCISIFIIFGISESISTVVDGIEAKEKFSEG